MLTKAINLITLSLLFGIIGAFLYSQAFSKKVIYIDLDTVINHTKDRIIEKYGKDPTSIQAVSAMVGEKIQKELKALADNHVIIAESAVLAGGENYSKYFEERIVRAIEKFSK